jgi:hypothetical protein
LLLALPWLLLVGCGKAPDQTATPQTHPTVRIEDPTDSAPPAQTAGDTEPATDVEPIAYRHDVRTEPRPLHLHVLTVRLDHPDIAFTSAIGPDPDGDGPAEATLVPPLQLATMHHLIAAVNANPFSGVPNADGKSHSNWHDGMHVTILGLAAADGETASPYQQNYPSVWQDTDGRIHIDKVADDTETEPPMAGGAGFHLMLKDGDVTAREGGPLHPRTAIGVDAAGTTLYLVVVDGRQDEYSEGMTVHELAVYLQEIGAHDAINLDGGGSSIMLLADETGALKTMNRPSARVLGVSLHRPVPILLGIRRRAEAE